MGIRWRRIIVGALFILILPVAFVTLIALAGPRERESAIRFAEMLAGWPDALAGAAFAGIVAWLVARPLSTGYVLHGLLTGVVAVALDVLVLVVAGSPFAWIHVASAAGVLAGAMLGGSVAARHGAT